MTTKVLGSLQMSYFLTLLLKNNRSDDFWFVFFFPVHFHSLLKKNRPSPERAHGLDFGTFYIQEEESKTVVFDVHKTRK